MQITILTDNQESWFIQYGNILKKELKVRGHKVNYAFDKKNIKNGAICFLLSCSKIIDVSSLKKNKHNIVVHASDLPKGKGFSPLKWQILEGKDAIVVTLIEAVENVDSGPYYFKDVIHFDGSELYHELRDKLGKKIIELCIFFVEKYGKLKVICQKGKESFYPKRTAKDDQIDPNKTIVEQFNHFRIADNENHPLRFYYKGKRYYLKIYKE